ncbi:MAG: AsmA family protein [Gammaproteobacteria bacterium]|nr:AsmA family protein [Gammaproteobacteria bacterium]MBU1775142.1 AsmA family protein [Gammaproteobacteria bacterium]MBU1967949.1 AsmA family protein [Gammaproteobacteria bacterium]
MNKYLKYSLWTVGGAIALLAAAITYIALTFDPNSYKPQIIQAVKDNNQRTLKLDGDIKLKFFPSIGLALGRVSLSEFGNAQEFAALEGASFSLKLFPLFAGHIVVDEVAVSGLKAHLVKYKDGKTNIDDLLSGEAAAAPQPAAEPAAAPMKFDIASVLLERTEFTYLDETTGARYGVKEMSLKTGRLANGVPTEIDLSMRVTASQPKVDIAARLKAGLTFDLGSNHYQLRGMDLQASGAALDYTGVVLNVSGDASVHPGTREFSAENLAFSASAEKDKERFEAKLDAPALNLVRDRFGGEGIALNARMNGAFGDITATLAVPVLEGKAQAFKVNALSVNIDLKQREQAFKARLISTLKGSLESRQFNLSDLSFAVSATGDNLPGKRIDSELKGSIQADLVRQYVEAKLAGGLLQSRIKAKASVKNFKVPMIRYAVEIDRFDADQFMPGKAEQAANGPAQSQAAEQPFDLSALKTLDVDGSLKVGSLKAANIKVAQLRVDVKARDGMVNIAPFSAKLYKGNINGKVTVNANTSSFTVKAKLSGVDIAPLMKDAADLDLAEGRGNITLDLATQGNTVSALKKALSGNVKVDLANGAIKGINLAKLVQGIQSLSKESTTQTLGVDKNEKTEFNEFKASFKVKNGIAHNDDLAVRSVVLRITGRGDIDIGHDNLRYNAKAAFAKTAQGKTATLPVTVYGAFDAVKFKIDYGALLKDVAKQKLDEKKEQLKEDAKAKAREELKKGLKNLFK